jgi:hypothetical protein
MDRFGRAWRAFLDLSSPRRRLLLHAWLLLPAVAVRLRVFGFARTRAALLAQADARKGLTNLGDAEFTACLVDAAARWSPVPASCLVRSLVLCRLLRQRGLASELRIGVATPDGHFSAHAWVEHDGVPLAEAGRVRENYSAFDKSILPRGI